MGHGLLNNFFFVDNLFLEQKFKFSKKKKKVYFDNLIIIYCDGYITAEMTIIAIVALFLILEKICIEDDMYFYHAYFYIKIIL